MFINFYFILFLYRRTRRWLSFYLLLKIEEILGQTSRIINDYRAVTVVIFAKIPLSAQKKEKERVCRFRYRSIKHHPARTGTKVQICFFHDHEGGTSQIGYCQREGGKYNLCCQELTGKTHPVATIWNQAMRPAIAFNSSVFINIGHWRGWRH